MHLLRTLQIAAEMPWDLPWTTLAVLVSAAVLRWLAPGERRHIRAALTLFGIGVAGLLVSAELLNLHVSPHSVVYRVLLNTSLFSSGVAFVKLAGVCVFAVVLRRIRLEPPPLAQDLLLALGFLGALVFSLTNAGVELDKILAASAIGTAVIGFSLQDTLGNIMGGLALQLERTISVGDWIKVDDIEGRVTQIRWRQTSVETRNWDTVVLPNSALMKARVTLLGRREGKPQQRRQWVYFRVDRSHPPTRIIHVVENALLADSIRNVAQEPKPHVLLTDYKDGDAVYAVRYWLMDLSSGDPTDSLVRIRVYGALRRDGIEIAAPAQSVTLHQETDTQRERKEEQALRTKFDALRRQEFFSGLTDEEIGALAPKVITAHFLRGENITRQGAEAHWLYIIAEGNAAVDVTVEGKSKRVAALHAGDIFGEMGLMTGEPRTATVSALTEVTCYRLASEDFKDTLLQRPAIADQISELLARRRVELDAAREQLGQAGKGERVLSLKAEFMRRIHSFFGSN